MVTSMITLLRGHDSQTNLATPAGTPRDDYIFALPYFKPYHFSLHHTKQKVPLVTV